MKLNKTHRVAWDWVIVGLVSRHGDFHGLQVLHSSYKLGFVPLFLSTFRFFVHQQYLHIGYEKAVEIGWYGFGAREG